MAIGTALAVGLGSAVLGAGASAISSSNNSKAINTATEATTESNAASLALQEDIYNQNKETLSPFVQSGTAAGSTLNALLGLNTQSSQTATQPAAQPQTNALATAAQTTNLPNNQLGQYLAQLYGSGDFGYGVGGYNPTAATTAAQQPQVQQTQQVTQADAQDGFRSYIDSSNYAFDLNEGFNDINSGYAGAGTLQSGAAMQGIEDYRQDLQNGYRNEYMGYLSNQQGVGLQAAGAQAGVGIDYANNVSNLNTSNANALSAAAVAKANNSNSLIGGITSGIGGILGGLG